MAPGTNPPDLGSSGTWVSKLSNLILNSSTEHPLKFLIYFGSLLKSLGAIILMLDSLCLFFVLGIEACLPLLSSAQFSLISSIPGLGTLFSIIFHK